MSPIIDPKYKAKHYAAMEKEREDADRAAKMEYIKPLLMFAIGVAVVVGYRLMAKPPIDDDGEAIPKLAIITVYFIGFAIELVCGVLGLWLAAKLWLGGVGPLSLCILRLAGIYAVTDAVALLAKPLMMIGWLISVCVYIGTLMWLFELEASESVMLAGITYALKWIAGAALIMMLASM